MIQSKARSKSSLTLLVLSLSLLVCVNCRNPHKKRSYQPNLWNNPNNNVNNNAEGINTNNNMHIGNGNSPNGGNPRFDYETGYATGVAMKKTLGLTKVILSPIVLPMIFFVGIVLLLFFAVVGSSAVIGNAWGRNRHPYHTAIFDKQFRSGTAKLASDVLNSDQCIERISCEVAKRARFILPEDLIMSSIQEIPSSENVLARITRSVKNPKNCHKFTCDSISMMSKAMQSLQG